MKYIIQLIDIVPQLLLFNSALGNKRLLTYFDTGCSRATLHKATADCLSLVPSGKETMMSITGQEQQVPIFSIPILKIGELELSNLQASAMDLSHFASIGQQIDLVVGYDLFSRHDVFISTSNRTLEVVPHGG